MTPTSNWRINQFIILGYAKTRFILLCYPWHFYLTYLDNLVFIVKRSDDVLYPRHSAILLVWEDITGLQKHRRRRSRLEQTLISCISFLMVYRNVLRDGWHQVQWQGKCRVKTWHILWMSKNLIQSSLQLTYLDIHQKTSWISERSVFRTLTNI